MAISTTVLPNGMKAYCLREAEVPVLYQQVQQYVRHGVELHPGDTLFDVGANIGLFSLWAYEQCDQDLSIYAFEPIPAVFEVLNRNAQVLPSARMKAFCCGLAQNKDSIVFDYYPNATPLSTAYPGDEQQIRELVEQAINTEITKSENDHRLDVWFLRMLPPVMRAFLVDYKLNEVLERQPVQCQMQKLSDIVRDHSVQQIDLLKIDVERAELDVLMGIELQDWSKIKQVVIEVHDKSQRLDRVTQLLESHGFSKIMTEQEPAFQGTDVFNLYAVR